MTFATAANDASRCCVSGKWLMLGGDDNQTHFDLFDESLDIIFLLFKRKIWQTWNLENYELGTLWWDSVSGERQVIVIWHMRVMGNF